MKMYNAPKTETPIIVSEDDSVEKKIRMLDSKIARLTEEVSHIKAMLQATNRATRRQNTDIHNLTTIVRNR
jgi:outer membrane murein-binding lipoprotein Lpp